MSRDLDYEKVFETIIEKVSNYLERNKLNSMVLGISGGIDSTVSAAICYEVALRTGIPLIGRSLPIKNKADEFNCSKLVGKAFCSDFEVIDLTELYTKYLKILATQEYYEIAENSLPDSPVDYKGLEELLNLQTRIANGNIQARLRMSYLYNIAGITKGIVIDTGNLTEYYTGFWTIHGDEGDISLLGGLWKTEIYKLAQYITEYYQKKGETDKVNAICISAGLTPTDGNDTSDTGSDLEQIGGNSYEEVDEILDRLTTQKTEEEISKDFDPETVKKVIGRYRSSMFKRFRVHTSYLVTREFYDEI